MAEQQKIKITIDDIPLDVEPGTTILNAARMIAAQVPPPPAMCYYSKLKDTGGKCRTCLVEVSQGSTADPRPMPKLVASCRTNVMDGMVVKNNTSERVQEARKGIVELLLINHPLDCPVCDQAGECSLQDLSYDHGRSATRYEFPRRTFEKQDLGPFIQLHMTRCILCYRCVFVAEQLTQKRVHGVLDRGERAQIATYIRQALHEDLIGNVIDVCPVGALTDKTFRFKQRVWFLQPVTAHRECPKCSGKVTLWYRGDEVFRVTARKDAFGEVEEWICNDCRFEHKKTSDWVIEGLAKVHRHSVISQGQYENLHIPENTLPNVMGRPPHLLLDIHSVSEVNQEDIDLSVLPRPANSGDFDGTNSKP